MYQEIILRNGDIVKGYCIRQYPAFEGGMRYIFKTVDGEYRCIKNAEGRFIEYVA